jgi:hypothetical protein
VVLWSLSALIGDDDEHVPASYEKLRQRQSPRKLRVRPFLYEGKSTDLTEFGALSSPSDGAEWPPNLRARVAIVFCGLQPERGARQSLAGGCVSGSTYQLGAAWNLVPCHVRVDASKSFSRVLIVGSAVVFVAYISAAYRLTIMK